MFPVWRVSEESKKITCLIIEPPPPNNHSQRSLLPNGWFRLQNFNFFLIILILFFKNFWNFFFQRASELIPTGILNWIFDFIKRGYELERYLFEIERRKRWVSVDAYELFQNRELFRTGITNHTIDISNELFFFGLSPTRNNQSKIDFLCMNSAFSTLWTITINSLFQNLWNRRITGQLTHMHEFDSIFLKRGEFCSRI